jgi:hypothetical protein
MVEVAWDGTLDPAPQTGAQCKFRGPSVYGLSSLKVVAVLPVPVGEGFGLVCFQGTAGEERQLLAR